MTRYLLVLLALACTSPLFAQSLEYEVDLTNSSTKRIKVTLKPQKLGSKKVSFQMPAWAPGAYSVTNYGRHVHEFQAFDTKGKALSVTRVDQNRWEIANAQKIAKIEYFVGDSRKDSTSLWFAMAHFDSNLFFANATALFGYVNDKKNVPARITYKKPAQWEIATALDYVKKAPRDCTFGQTRFKAANYDELVDAPVIAAPELQIRCFDQGGAKYQIALVSNREFPMDSLEAHTKKIVKAQTDFFGETPFKHYTFLYYAPTFMQLPSMGQGALEHMNSSAYLMMHQPWAQFKDGGLRIISHEFFHLWNVKRIHSTLLGPFDYTKGVRTTSLWLLEGVTDYYAHALLARNGLMSSDKFLGDIREWYMHYRGSRPALTKSLEQISLEESEFNMESVAVLYTKGPLVGLMLDAEIRTRTNNRKSLDDAMLALNKDAKRGKHFKDEELIGKIAKVVGLDLSDFHKKYIAGTDSIHVEDVLSKLGLTSRLDLASEIAPEGHTGVDKLRLSTTPSGEAVVTLLPTTLFLAQAGFMLGDTILSLNSNPITAAKFRTALADSDRNMEHVAVVRRNGEEYTIRFKAAALEQRRTQNGARPLFFRVARIQTPLRIAIRDSIMGKLTD